MDVAPNSVGESTKEQCEINLESIHNRALDNFALVITRRIQAREILFPLPPVSEIPKVIGIDVLLIRNSILATTWTNHWLKLFSENWRQVFVEDATAWVMTEKRKYEDVLVNHFAGVLFLTRIKVITHILGKLLEHYPRSRSVVNGLVGNPEEAFKVFSCLSLGSTVPKSANRTKDPRQQDRAQDIWMYALENIEAILDPIIELWSKQMSEAPEHDWFQQAITNWGEHEIGIVFKGAMRLPAILAAELSHNLGVIPTAVRRDEIDRLKNVKNPESGQAYDYLQRASQRVDLVGVTQTERDDISTVAAKSKEYYRDAGGLYDLEHLAHVKQSLEALKRQLDSRAYSIVTTILEDPGISDRELARRLKVDKKTISKLRNSIKATAIQIGID